MNTVTVDRSELTAILTELKELRKAVDGVAGNAPRYLTEREAMEVFKVAGQI